MSSQRQPININGAIITEAVVKQLRDLQEEEHFQALQNAIKDSCRMLANFAHLHGNEKDAYEVVSLQGSLYWISDIFADLSTVDESVKPPQAPKP